MNPALRHTPQRPVNQIVTLSAKDAPLHNISKSNSGKLQKSNELLRSLINVKQRIPEPTQPSRLQAGDFHGSAASWDLEFAIHGLTEFWLHIPKHA